MISALMAFHDKVKFSNPDEYASRHDELLRELMLAVRKDVGLAKDDDALTFNFHLIGSVPRNPETR